MQTRSIRLLIPAALALLLTGAATAQTIYYVDVANGSDANPGTSPGAAFQTVNFAIGAAQSGDTINVLPGGIYNEQVVIDKDGLRIEALPTARFENPGGLWTAFEIDATNGPITNATVVRGFEIDGMGNGGTGILAHNDLSGATDFDISPVIKNNRVLNTSSAITVKVSGVNATSQAYIEHNFIDAHQGPCSAPFAFGIFLNPDLVADMDVTIEQNEVYGTEFGIGLFNQSGGTVEIFSNCNTISQCEWGILISGGVSDAVFVNETVAYGNPASFGQTMQGIEVDSPNVFVYNSIVWIPDDNSCNGLQGVDLVGFGPGGATIDAASIVLDQGDPDPQFLDPTPGVWEFRVAPTSPAIDAGDTSIVEPMGPYTVVMDNRGESRILAGFFDHTMEVDVGAHEFTQLTFDIAVTGYPGYSGADEPCVSTQIGSPYTFTLTGPTNGLAYLLVGRPPSMKRLLPDLGYQIAPALRLYGPTPMTTGSVSWTFTLPNLNAVESLILYQGAALVPFPGPPRTGNFTRLIEVELNL